MGRDVVSDVRSVGVESHAKRWSPGWKLVLDQGRGVEGPSAFLVMAGKEGGPAKDDWRGAK